MKHLHKASGKTFECGELMEFPANGTRKTYDMTVISLWEDDPDHDPQPVIIVGYYFGEYNEETTDYYIDQWFQKQAMENEWLKLVSSCQDIVNAYWLTNEDVLPDEGSLSCSKVRQTLDSLNELMEVITNE